MTDWYRNTSWTPAIESDFNARLNRSRTEFTRCQYLYIQASTLRATGQEELLATAIRLADRALREHPHDMFLAGLHLTRAEALTDLGRYDEAIDAFRSAVRAQRERPGVKHLTHLPFGELALALCRADLYPEIEALFPKFGDADDLFPCNAFRSHYIQAAFAEARADLRTAREHASLALAAAAATQTQFRYHRTLGLFQGVSPDVLDHLRRLTTA